MNAQTEAMLRAMITCSCRYSLEVNVPTMRDAHMLADKHERDNIRRAYRHDASAMEIAR